MRRKIFRQCWNSALQKTTRYSLLAIRFRFLARQEPRPPTNSPTEVGAKFLRHQLRVEARSMVCFWLRHQLQAKACSMDGFCCATNCSCYWL